MSPLLRLKVLIVLKEVLHSLLTFLFICLQFEVAIKMEMKEEVTDEEKDGIWQFPSCLIQDVKCVKEEMADEITIKEEGVYREVEDESNAHSSYEGFCCMDDTVGVWPAEVEMTGDCISQEWGSAYVKELGQIR
jgi:hypothetical protein